MCKLLAFGARAAVTISMAMMLGGCVTEFASMDTGTVLIPKTERTAPVYEARGNYWGKTLAGKNLPGSPLNMNFVNDLKSSDSLDYFQVHSELKDAFKKGFRIGYMDRVADLVLGPHITAAAGSIGESAANRFVQVVDAFETGWADTLRNAVNVFIVLIAEGSQADRETFVKNFHDRYSAKYQDNKQKIASGNYLEVVSKGGTILFIDMSKGKALGALAIPDPEVLKTIIYNQAFTTMGDEWGRRFSTNLIKRDELVDLIRRSKPAMQELKDQNLAKSLDYVERAFVRSYGTDADEVFQGLLKDAGYKDLNTGKTQGRR